MEEAEVGVHCSSSLSPHLAPVSSQLKEKLRGSLLKPYDLGWLAAGHPHSFYSLIGQCMCQLGPGDCSYCGFLENHHCGIKQVHTERFSHISVNENKPPPPFFIEEMNFRY